MTLAVAEPNGVAMAQHDVVGAGPTVYRLVEVVTHGVVIGQALEIWHVALLHVIKAQSRRAFAGHLGRRRVLLV